MKISDIKLETVKKTVGIDTTLKNLYLGKIKEILLASNYPKEKEENLRNISEKYEVPVAKLEVDSKKLGTLCKKTFNISVIGLLKEE